ncbi:MAG: HisA/HisF-related TIM barrel protein [Promethearchaeota archaeon]|jgi:phosphoribosylformimino-5-aminoimidazole carboxamide ribotide isomerase
MVQFKVIPVLDILKSEAVHAVKGERSKYKPLKSHLFKKSDPFNILEVLRLNYKFRDFYIADLDAIINRTPNFQLLQKILRISGIKIKIDPGIIDIDDILLFSKYNIDKLIIGLETVGSLETIKKAFRIMGKSKLIISIDMYKEKVISNAIDIKNKSIIEITRQIEEFGIKDIILLDLFRVGQKIGGIPQHYLEIQDIFKGNIYVGGGIKDYKDILKYKNLNFAGVLIATALYDGTLSIEKIRNFSNS